MTLITFLTFLFLTIIFIENLSFLIFWILLISNFNLNLYNWTLIYKLKFETIFEFLNYKLYKKHKKHIKKQKKDVNNKSNWSHPALGFVTSSELTFISFELIIIIKTFAYFIKRMFRYQAHHEDSLWH